MRAKSQSAKERIKLYARTREPRRGPTCIDLFAGAGGLAEGFRQAGWSIRAANDLDAHAGQTFRLNFPECAFHEGPISALSTRKLMRDAGLKQGELDCLIGGPPCQSFSYNNHQRSATDVRARLFRTYLRIVRALFPKTLVMENVPGMLTIGSGRIIDEIRDELLQLGYACDVRILYSEDFGVPQARRRAFIIATRLGEPAGLFPPGSHGPSTKPSEDSNTFVHRWEPSGRNSAQPFVTVWDAIGDLPHLGNGGGSEIVSYRKAAATKFQRGIRGRARKVRNHQCHVLTKAMLRRIEFVSEGGNWTQIPHKMLPAGMRRARPSDHTKRYGRLRRKGLASTILTKCDPHWGAYIHPTQDRTVTVREAARLQGFPDRFRFAGRFIGKHYEQVGNAVPIQVARAIGAAVSTHVIGHVKAARRKSLSIRKRPPAKVQRPRAPIEQRARPLPARAAGVLTRWRRRRSSGRRMPYRRRFSNRARQRASAGGRV